MCGTDFFLGVLSIFFPPIGVWIKRGICTADSLINLALCCLGYLPGLLHAWYIIASYPDPYASDDYYSSAPSGPGDAEQGRGIVTYYYVQPGPAPQGQYRGHGQPAYGTLNPSVPSGGQFLGGQSGSVNAFPAPGTSAGKDGKGGDGVRREGGGGGEGSAARVEETPPSYQEAIKGDHKVQSQE